MLKMCGNKSKFLSKLNTAGKNNQEVSDSVLRLTTGFVLFCFFCFQYLINSTSAERCFLNCFIVHCFSAHFCQWHFCCSVQSIRWTKHTQNAATIKKFIVFYNCTLNVLNLFSSWIKYTYHHREQHAHIWNWLAG